MPQVDCPIAPSLPFIPNHQESPPIQEDFSSTDRNQLSNVDPVDRGEQTNGKREDPSDNDGGSDDDDNRSRRLT